MADLRSRPPSPLFLPALAFALGCGLGNVVPGTFLPWFGGLLALFWVGWGLGRQERLTRAAFLAAILIGAMVYALLPRVFVPADDLRALPATKFETPTWEGTIASLPEFHPLKRDAAEGRVRFVFRVERWKNGEAWIPAQGKIETTLEAVHDVWQFGQHLQITAPLVEPPPAEGPGRFDARGFLAGRGIDYQIDAAEEQVEMLSPPSPFLTRTMAAIDTTRRWALDRLRLGIENDPATASVLTGIILGRAEQVPLLLLSYFRTTGTYHLFSVSGENLAVLFGLTLAALRLCGLVRWRWGWLAAPLLLAYAMACGGHPGIIRALGMNAAVLLAWRIGRPVAPLNLWSFVLGIVLAVNPRAALDMGFQFSFIVVLALIVLSPIFYRAFLKLGAIDPLIPVRYAPKPLQARSRMNRFAAGFLAGSVAAWIGAVPLELYYFHQICLASIPANLAAIPLAGLIFFVGALALLGAFIHPFVTVLFNNANWAFAKILILLVTLLAHCPDASIYVPPLGPLGRDRDPQIIVTPSGRGTTLLIRHQGRAWLLNPSDENGFFRDVEPMRKYFGVNRLAGLILAQWNGAEAGAAPSVVQVLPVERVAAPPGKAPAWATRLTPEMWTAGQKVDLGNGLTVTILSPNPDHLARQAGDRGLVLLLDYAGARLLYAGSISFGIEQEVLTANPGMIASILVEGRHPTEGNLTPDWLTALAPNDIIWTSHPGGTAIHSVPMGRDATAGPRLWNQAETPTIIATLHADGTATVAEWKAD